MRTFLWFLVWKGSCPEEDTSGRVGALGPRRWGGFSAYQGSATHVLGSTTQYNIAAGSLPLDLAKGGGDQGIFEEEEGPRIVENEDVVLGGQEAAVAMG